MVRLYSMKMILDQYCHLNYWMTKLYSYKKHFLFQVDVSLNSPTTNIVQLRLK